MSVGRRPVEGREEMATHARRALEDAIESGNAFAVLNVLPVNVEGGHDTDVIGDVAMCYGLTPCEPKLGKLKLANALLQLSRTISRDLL